MTIPIRPGEEHLAYAPERHADQRHPAPEPWPAWDEREDEEGE